MENSLSDFYTESYLTEGSWRLDGDKGGDQTARKHKDIEDYIEDDEYVATPPSENAVEHKPKMKSESAFDKLFGSVINEEFEDEFGGGEDFDAEMDDGGGEEEETINVPVATLRDICSQLESLIGGEEEVDDYSYDDGLEGDDVVPEEAVDYATAGDGSKQLDGDYSGKAKDLPGSKDITPDGRPVLSRQKTGYAPEEEEGSEGSKELDGDYSGKAQNLGGSKHVSPGGVPSRNQKVGGKKSSVGEKLFGR